MQVSHSGGTANFNLRSSLKKAKITGLSTAVVNKVRTKFDKKFGLKAECLTEKIEILGNYTMDGQILVLPIKGRGKMLNSMTNVKTLIDLRGDYFDKDGETYINITSFKMRLIPGGATFNFENLFNGDQELSQTINNFMNENWEIVEQTLLPGYEAKLGDEYREIANKLFHKVPMKMIFPE
jgi:Haemolymph juvenile hormone binding protein (JHBP)